MRKKPTLIVRGPKASPAFMADARAYVAARLEDARRAALVSPCVVCRRAAELREPLGEHRHRDALGRSV